MSGLHTAAFFLSCQFVGCALTLFFSRREYKKRVDRDCERWRKRDEDGR